MESVTEFRTRKDKECLEQRGCMLPRLFDYVDKYAKEKGKELAIIEYNTEETVTWSDFALKTRAFAAKLLSMGIQKGDVVATTLPLLKEHVFLMYACFRIGAKFAPLDPRLKASEVIACFAKMNPVAYFFLGKTPIIDFRPMVREVMKAHGPTVKHWIQFQKEEDMIIEGATGVTKWASDIKYLFVQNMVKSAFGYGLWWRQQAVDAKDVALIIFTTGSTGAPKPAQLTHENVLIQNLALAVNFEIHPSDRMLVNLPPSHVGCVTEQLATSIFTGITSVILHMFKPDDSLSAIQKHKVTLLGQIPALFNLEWKLPNYSEYDLSTVRFALYGGQAVTRQFLEKLATMAQTFGSGLGLTETAGFCTFTPLNGTVDDLSAGIGFACPLCPISIRLPMLENGFAGAEVSSPGQIGEICFSGPQIFAGYLNDEESTRKTVSRDGFCYTGDLGSYDERGLHFAGRSKQVIKPKGYQVFPSEVEEVICSVLQDKVQNAAVVGVDHAIYSEAIVLFVEKKADIETLTVSEVHKASSEMAAYKRPSHVELIEHGQMPLNRVAKTDYMALKERAKEIVAQLRTQGKWDQE